MPNPRLIREALMKLMGAKRANKGIDPSERSFRTQFEDVGDYGEPTVGEVVNQSPTMAGARQQAIEGPAGGFAFGTFPDDPTSAAVRQARIRSNAAQGSDPLGEVGMHGGPRRYGEQSEIGKRPTGLARDPSRLPDGPAAGEVPGSNEAITLFEQLMDAVEGGTDPLTLGPQLTRLRQIAPEFFLSVSDTIKQKKRVNPSIAQDIDDIPF